MQHYEDMRRFPLTMRARLQGWVELKMGTRQVEGLNATSRDLVTNSLTPEAGELKVKLLAQDSRLQNT